MCDVREDTVKSLSEALDRTSHARPSREPFPSNLQAPSSVVLLLKTLAECVCIQELQSLDEMDYHRLMSVLTKPIISVSSMLFV